LTRHNGLRCSPEQRPIEPAPLQAIGDSLLRVISTSRLDSRSPIAVVALVAAFVSAAIPAARAARIRPAVELHT
jgi:ABC-type lipoprotein release transport system permease subunit